MNTFTDSKYLRKQQYKTPENLNKRASLHVRFGTNPIPWHRWVCDQFGDLDGARILDAGCGPAYLWAENTNWIPGTCSINLMDLSAGMLSAAKQSLVGTQLSFVQGNVEQIPLESNQFDLALANHMLYHVPDIGLALKQIRRVLKPGGRFYAATNGFRNLIEVWEWVAQALPSRADILASRDVILRFSLENGEQLLSPYFSSVKLLRYPDSLEVNEAQPIVDFVESSKVQAHLSEDELSAYKEFLEQKLIAQKILKVSKDMGIFVAE